MSILYTPWTQQPQQAVGIDLGNPIARGAYAWTPHNPRQLVGARTVQAFGETAYNSSPVGDKGVARKWSRSANAGVDFGTQQIITQNSGVTVLVVAAPTSAATMKVPFSQRVAGGSYTQTDFVFNSSSIDSLGATAGTVVLTTYHSAPGGVKADSQIDGKTHCWIAGNGSANGYIYRDGVKQTLSTSTRISTFYNASQKLRVGNMGDDASTTHPCDDPVYLVVVWDRLLSEAEAKTVSENPWQIFKPIPRRIFVPVSAGGGIYTLNAQSGSYTTTGQSATLLKHRNLSASSGSYSVTGQSVNITYSPTAAVYTLIAQTGSYGITGRSAALLRHRSLSTTTGSYSVSGQSAGLFKNRVLTASSGSYSITGRSVTITYTPTTPVYTLTAQTGTYALTGQTATLLRHRLLTGSSGTYAYTGQSISIEKYTAGTGTLVKYINVLTGELLILKQIN
jgi:hypothetical protein